MSTVAAHLPIGKLSPCTRCMCVCVCARAFACARGLSSSFLFCPCPAASVLSPHCGNIFKSLLHLDTCHQHSDVLQSLSLKQQKQHKNSKNFLDSHMPLKLLTPISLPLTATVIQRITLPRAFTSTHFIHSQMIPLRHLFPSPKQPALVWVTADLAPRS